MRCGRFVFLIAMLLLVSTLIFHGCNEPEEESSGDPTPDTPGAPENFEIYGYEHQYVLLRWEEPVFGNQQITGYRVYGQARGDTTKVLGTTTETTFYHDSWDDNANRYSTFNYYVKSYNDNGEGPACLSKDSHPYHTTCELRVELDRDIADEGQAGIYFDRSNGRAEDVYVSSISVADQFELYLTDFVEGWGGTGGLYLCSSAFGSYYSADADRIKDFAGELEDCLFLDTVNSVDFPDRVYGTFEAYYITYVTLSENYIVINTRDNHYALVKACGPVDSSTGQIELEFWFQELQDYGIFSD